PLRAHLLDLLVEVADPLADAPALALDLLLAGTAAGPHSPPPPARLAVVRPRADQAGQQVMKARRLDLQPALVRPGVLGEDLEDHLRAVEDAHLQFALEVPLLARRQVLVADDDVERALVPESAQLLDLPHADEVRRLDLRTALHVGADDISAGGAGQVRELEHLLAHLLFRRTGQQDPDQVGALARCLDRDQRRSFSMRLIASARRASGAVTESRK